MKIRGVYSRWSDAIRDANFLAAEDGRRHRVMRDPEFFQLRTVWLVTEVGS